MGFTTRAVHVLHGRRHYELAPGSKADQEGGGQMTLKTGLGLQWWKPPELHRTEQNGDRRCCAGSDLQPSGMRIN